MALIASGRQARSVRAIGKAVRGGSDSAVATVSEAWQRIDEVNPQINAIVTPLRDRSLERAAVIDRHAQQFPLAGVPFTVKDIVAVGGVRCTGGSRILADYTPGFSAPVVERLEAAGAVLIGKANCPEFALDMHTSNALFGETRSPWDLAWTTGGSSGGDAAAVASGCAAFGIGTDYGGSIRWPAHCTGLVGLRPTPGLVSTTGQIPFPRPSIAAQFQDPAWLPPANSVSLQGMLQQICPIARFVDDIWTLLTIMAGTDDRGSHVAPVPLGNPDEIDPRALRVAWCYGDGSFPVREDVRAVTADASAALARRKLKVERQQPPFLELVEPIFDEFRMADGLPDHRALIGENFELLTDNMRGWLSGERQLTVERYRQLAADRDSLRAVILQFLSSWPVLLMPVASIPAFEPNPTSFEVEGVEIPRFHIINCCRVISVLGLPSLVVPFGCSADGRPIGVQVIGRPFHEAELIAVGRVLEKEAELRWQ